MKKANVKKSENNQQYMIDQGVWSMIENEEELLEYLKSQCLNKGALEKILSKGNPLENLVLEMQYSKFNSMLEAIKDNEIIFLNDCGGYNIQNKEQFYANYTVEVIK